MSSDFRAMINRFIKCMVMGSFPLIFAFLTCAFYHRSISDIYIPNSLWNDEFFYYKLVEGTLKYGIPQGYFGYNDSHALCLSFGTWNPVILLPWIIWGKLVGWNYLAPIIFNISILSITLIGITIGLKLEWKQIITILISLFGYFHFIRYTLSCMPEVLFWVLGIIVVSLFVSYSRNHKKYKLIIAAIIVFYMVLSRPYFVFLYFYIFSQFWKKKHIRIMLSIVTIVNVLLYFIMTHFLSAPYLTQTIKLNIFSTDFIIKIIHDFKSCVHICIECIIKGNGAGGQYIGFFLILLFNTLLLVGVLKNRNNQCEVLLFQYVIAALGFFLSVISFYGIEQGGRHTSVFVITGIILFALVNNNKRFLLVYFVTVAITFSFIYYYIHNTIFDYQLPFYNEELSCQLEELSLRLDNVMELSDEGTPNYDNTIIWVFSDNVDGIDTRIDFRQFYAVPDGFGINLCLNTFVFENMESIKSKYIGTVPNGDIDKKLNDLGKDVVARNDNIIIYQLY